MEVRLEEPARRCANEQARERPSSLVAALSLPKAPLSGISSSCDADDVRRYVPLLHRKRDRQVRMLARSAFALARSGGSSWTKEQSPPRVELAPFSPACSGAVPLRRFEVLSLLHSSLLTLSSSPSQTLGLGPKPWKRSCLPRFVLSSRSCTHAYG
jgi:hypothetical protein